MITSQPGVYLIELEEPLKRNKGGAKYYLGSAANVLSRITRHKKGLGSRFLAVANERNIKWSVIRVWNTETTQEARELEAKFKRQHNHGRLANKTV